jgi:hypothetical protein
MQYKAVEDTAPKNAVHPPQAALKHKKTDEPTLSQDSLAPSVLFYEKMYYILRLNYRNRDKDYALRVRCAARTQQAKGFRSEPPGVHHRKPATLINHISTLPKTCFLRKWGVNALLMPIFETKTAYL